MSVEVGGILDGVVTGLTHFGAFVQLPNGKVGLVHISEVADVFVRDIKDYLKANDRVRVKVLSYDDKGKIALSIRQANPNATPHRAFRREERRTVHMSFEDKLARFLRESDERLSTLRRQHDGKRGGRGASRGRVAF